MQCIILAAGFGERMGEYGLKAPKPLLPLAKGCILDRVVTSIWVEGITSVNIIHNNHASFKHGEWPKKFKKWKEGLQWIPEDGKRQESPFIKLLNNGIHSKEGRAGAVGDLAAAIHRNTHRDRPILVVCGDDLFPNPHLEELKGFDGKTSAITVRSTADLDPLVLEGNPSEVRVDAGLVEEIGQDILDTPWRYCGPFYIAGKDVPFVLEYVDYMGKAGILPDAIDGLIDAMVSDGCEVRAVKVSTRFFSISNEKLYKTAVQRMGVFMKRNEAAVRQKGNMVDRLRAGKLNEQDVQRIEKMAVVNK